MDLRERVERAKADGTLIGVVLAEVRDTQPITVADVAANLGESASTVRRLLAQLEEAGLVEWDNYQRRARVYLATEKEG